MLRARTWSETVCCSSDCTSIRHSGWPVHDQPVVKFHTLNHSTSTFLHSALSLHKEGPLGILDTHSPGPIERCLVRSCFLCFHRSPHRDHEKFPCGLHMTTLAATLCRSAALPNWCTSPSAHTGEQPGDVNDRLSLTWHSPRQASAAASSMTPMTWVALKSRYSSVCSGGGLGLNICSRNGCQKGSGMVGATPSSHRHSDKKESPPAQRRERLASRALQGDCRSPCKAFY